MHLDARLLLAARLWAPIAQARRRAQRSRAAVALPLHGQERARNSLPLLVQRMTKFQPAPVRSVGMARTRSVSIDTELVRTTVV
jgi:hypothetical protein